MESSLEPTPLVNRRQVPADVSRHLTLHGVVAARLVADRYRHTRQVFRNPNGRIGRDEYPGRSDGVDVRVELPVTVRSGDLDRPVAGTAYVGASALLEGPINADPVALVVSPAVGSPNVFIELVARPLVDELVLFLGNAFLQADMRLNDGFRHLELSLVKRTALR